MKKIKTFLLFFIITHVFLCAYETVCSMNAEINVEPTTKPISSCEQTVEEKNTEEENKPIFL